MKYAFLGVVLLLGACTQVIPPSQETAQSAVEQMTFVQNSRTGLCFGVVSSATYWNYYVVSITQVDCTPEVLAEIRR